MIGGTKKPTKRRPLGTPSHGHESDSERETSGSHQSTTHQPSGQQHKPSTSARPDERPDPTPVRRPKPRVRRPGDPSAGGIHLGGNGDDGDDGDAPGAQAGRGDYSTGLGHPSGGHDDSRDAEPRLPSASDPAPKPKPKPKPKSRETGKDNRTDDDEPAVSGDEAGGDPKVGRQPGGLNNPERLGKGTKKSRGINPDEDDDVEKTVLGNEPERIHVKKDDASASSKVPDAFDDEGDNELTRIQRRINAIRKGGRAKGVALAEDDADLEAVDLTLFEKFAISAAERQKRMKKTLMVNDPEMQIDIANALAETLKPRWPEYAAMGFKVAFFIGDIALIVNGITDDFYLIDIPAKEIIEGAVNLYTRLRETPEEKEAAKRNGRGESAKKLEERRQKGEVALMELTGVKNLNKQQRETYDRLRVLLAMEKKESKAE